VAELPGPLRDYEPIQPRGTDWRRLARIVLAPIAAIVALALKFGVAFAKLGSIFVALAGYALIWGWRFAIGFVLLILVHELGHFLEARRLGLRPSLPVFIPFLGAYVAIKDARLNPWQHARIALAGPVAGALAAVAFLVAADVTGSRLLSALAYSGFLLNLFNLIPIGFLDGGQIARSYRYLRLGGAPRRAYVLASVAVAVAFLLVLGMAATHVGQDRL